MDTHRLEEVAATNAALLPHEWSFVQQEVATRRQLIAKLVTECEFYEALLSPMRQHPLPPELLGEIFSYALADPYLRVSVTVQLRNISLVCRSWRQAALASPRLWCTVDNFGPQANEESHGFRRVQTWLMRGGTLPKDLRVSEYSLNESGPTSCSVSHGRLASLLTEVPFIEKLSLSCHGMRCFQELMGNVEPTMKGAHGRFKESLRSLKLAIHTECWRESDHPQLDTLRHLPPHLVFLKLDLPCFVDLPNGSLVPRPLSSHSIAILEISMSFWPVHWLLHCAESCPKLRHLTISLGDKDANWTVGPSYPGKAFYMFPFLIVFRFRRLRDRCTTTGMLRHLKTPSLVEIDIAFDYTRDGAGEAALNRDPDFENFLSDILIFMNQSDCANTLRCARIRSVCLHWGVLGPILRALHPVTHLSLDQVWTQYRWPVWGLPLLPRLQSLEVLNLDSTFDYETIMSFVRNRAKPSPGLSCIEKLRMSICRTPAWDHPGEHAKDLKANGVDVKITLNNPRDIWFEAKTVSK